MSNRTDSTTRQGFPQASEERPDGLLELEDELEEDNDEAFRLLHSRSDTCLDSDGAEEWGQEAGEHFWNVMLSKDSKSRPRRSMGKNRH
jgi:hypothetical protein